MNFKKKLTTRGIAILCVITMLFMIIQPIVVSAAEASIVDAVTAKKGDTLGLDKAPLLNVNLDKDLRSKSYFDLVLDGASWNLPQPTGSLKSLFGTESLYNSKAQDKNKVAWDKTLPAEDDTVTFNETFMSTMSVTAITMQKSAGIAQISSNNWQTFETDSIILYDYDPSVLGSSVVTWHSSNTAVATVQNYNTYGYGIRLTKTGEGYADIYAESPVDGVDTELIRFRVNTSSSSQDPSVSLSAVEDITEIAPLSSLFKMEGSVRTAFVGLTALNVMEGLSWTTSSDNLSVITNNPTRLEFRRSGTSNSAQIVEITVSTNGTIINKFLVHLLANASSKVVSMDINGAGIQQLGSGSLQFTKQGGTTVNGAVTFRTDAGLLAGNTISWTLTGSGAGQVNLLQNTSTVSTDNIVMIIFSDVSFTATPVNFTLVGKVGVNTVLEIPCYISSSTGAGIVTITKPLTSLFQIGTSQDWILPIATNSGNLTFTKDASVGALDWTIDKPAAASIKVIGSDITITKSDYLNKTEVVRIIAKDGNTEVYSFTVLLQVADENNPNSSISLHLSSFPTKITKPTSAFLVPTTMAVDELDALVAVYENIAPNAVAWTSNNIGILAVNAVGTTINITKKSQPQYDTTVKISANSTEFSFLVKGTGGSSGAEPKVYARPINGSEVTYNSITQYYRLPTASNSGEIAIEKNDFQSETTLTWMNDNPTKVNVVYDDVNQILTVSRIETSTTELIETITGSINGISALVIHVVIEPKSDIVNPDPNPSIIISHSTGVTKLGNDYHIDASVATGRFNVQKVDFKGDEVLEVGSSDEQIAVTPSSDWSHFNVTRAVETTVDKNVVITVTLNGTVATTFNLTVKASQVIVEPDPVVTYSISAGASLVNGNYVSSDLYEKVVLDLVYENTAANEITWTLSNTTVASLSTEAGKLIITKLTALSSNTSIAVVGKIGDKIVMSVSVILVPMSIAEEQPLELVSDIGFSIGHSVNFIMDEGIRTGVLEVDYGIYNPIEVIWSTNNTGVSVSKTNLNRTITVTRATDYNDSAVVTITATDLAGVAIATFTMYLPEAEDVRQSMSVKIDRGFAKDGEVYLINSEDESVLSVTAGNFAVIPGLSAQYPVGMTLTVDRGLVTIKDLNKSFSEQEFTVILSAPGFIEEVLTIRAPKIEDGGNPEDPEDPTDPTTPSVLDKEGFTSTDNKNFTLSANTKTGTISFKDSEEWAAFTQGNYDGITILANDEMNTFNFSVDKTLDTDAVITFKFSKEGEDDVFFKATIIKRVVVKETWFNITDSIGFNKINDLYYELPSNLNAGHLDFESSDSAEFVTTISDPSKVRITKALGDNSFRADVSEVLEEDVTATITALVDNTTTYTITLVFKATDTNFSHYYVLSYPDTKVFVDSDNIVNVPSSVQDFTVRFDSTGATNQLVLVAEDEELVTVQNLVKFAKTEGHSFVNMQVSPVTEIIETKVNIYVDNGTELQLIGDIKIKLNKTKETPITPPIDEEEDYFEMINVDARVFFDNSKVIYVPSNTRDFFIKFEGRGKTDKLFFESKNTALAQIISPIELKDKTGSALTAVAVGDVLETTTCIIEILVEDEAGTKVKIDEITLFISANYTEPLPPDPPIIINPPKVITGSLDNFSYKQIDNNILQIWIEDGYETSNGVNLYIPMFTKITGDGDATVRIEAKGGGTNITEKTVQFAYSSEKGTTAYIHGQSVTYDRADLNMISISENSPNVIQPGTMTVELIGGTFITNNDWTYSMSGVLGSDLRFTSKVNYTTNKVATLTLAKNEPNDSSIRVSRTGGINLTGIKIQKDEDMVSGVIQMRISGAGISPITIDVAKVVGEAISLDLVGDNVKIPIIKSGTFPAKDTDSSIATAVFSIKGALSESKRLNISIPDGVIIRALEILKVENVPNVNKGDMVYHEDNDKANANHLITITDDLIKIRRADSVSQDIGTIELKAYVSVEGTLDESIILKYEEEEVEIAVAKPAITVNSQSAIITEAAKDKLVNDIIITETEAGMLQTTSDTIATAYPKVIFLDNSFNTADMVLQVDGFTITGYTKVEVTEGDLKIKDVKLVGGNLLINFNGKSTKASKIGILGLKVTSKFNSLPKGGVSLMVGGEAVIGNWYDGKSKEPINYFTTNAIERKSFIVSNASEVLSDLVSKETVQAKIVIGEKTIELSDGTKIEMDVEAFIENGRTYLPIRFIAYALGLKDENIIWNDLHKSVTLINGTGLVHMSIGDVNMYKVSVNASAPSKLVMDVAPTITKDRTMLPVRWVAEAFDAEVEWNEAEQTVIIFYSK